MQIPPLNLCLILNGIIHADIKQMGSSLDDPILSYPYWRKYYKPSITVFQLCLSSISPYWIP